MSMSSEQGRRLKGFRLSQVPLEVRRRAAKSVAHSLGSEPSAEVKPVDRLFARLQADRDAGADSGDVKVLVRIAEHPSDRVYWVSQAAWDRVMGNRRARR